MIEILICAGKIVFILLIMLSFGVVGVFMGKRVNRNIWIFFFVTFFTGPVGLIALYLFVKLPKKYLGYFATLSVFILIALLFSQTTLFSGMEWGSIDFRFYLRDPSQKSVKLEDGVKMHRVNSRARKDIVILGIDENTIREFSNQGIQWPFPWELHAKLTKFVASGNPAAIFFDIMFLDHKDGEAKLAESIKQSKVAFLGYPFETDEIDVNYEDQTERMKLLNRVRFPVDDKDRSRTLVDEVVPVTPDLLKASKGVGFVNIFSDGDRVNRTMPLIRKFKGWYYPNIDLVIAMQYYGISPKDVEIKIGKYIKLKNVSIEKMAVPNKDREIVIPIDEYGFMNINFIGGSGSFQHYPYYLFARDGTMEGNDSLKDKILLVAAYSVTGVATDEQKSPYGTIFGIEHHANTLNTILNQDFLYKLTDLQNILVMLGIALLLGFFIPRMSIGLSLLATVFFLIFYSVGSYLLFDYLSIITAMTTPLLQTVLTYTVIATYRVINEQQEKKYIRQTFSKFVSKSVVDELLRDPSKIKLGGEKKILTVLFSDIRGFTAISEKITPEQLVEYINTYFQVMTDIVIKYSGTLDKYVGDEIMAFWGAPIEMDDHALQACRAALEMMNVLQKMNEKWDAEGKPILNIGIGINTGDMIVGNIGSSSRMDYTLMGDNVNLGSRLESTNKVYKTNVIISDFTYQHVKNHIYARELDILRVKGKEAPVKIYELIAMKD